MVPSLESWTRVKLLYCFMEELLSFVHWMHWNRWIYGMHTCIQWIFPGACVNWFYGVTVSTLDFESKDPSSNLGRTSFFYFFFFFSISTCVYIIFFHVYIFAILFLHSVASHSDIPCGSATNEWHSNGYMGQSSTTGRVRRWRSTTSCVQYPWTITCTLSTTC